MMTNLQGTPTPNAVFVLVVFVYIPKKISQLVTSKEIQTVVVVGQKQNIYIYTHHTHTHVSIYIYTRTHIHTHLETLMPQIYFEAYKFRRSIFKTMANTKVFLN